MSTPQVKVFATGQLDVGFALRQQQHFRPPCRAERGRSPARTADFVHDLAEEFESVRSSAVATDAVRLMKVMGHHGSGGDIEFLNGVRAHMDDVVDVLERAIDQQKLCIRDQ